MQFSCMRARARQAPNDAISGDFRRGKRKRRGSTSPLTLKSRKRLKKGECEDFPANRATHSHNTSPHSSHSCLDDE